MTPVRILYVDTDRVWRGGQEQLFSLMMGLKNRGHQVQLAAPEESPLAQRARRLGIPTRCFSQHFELSPLAMLRMARILGWERPDVIHFNNPHPILTGGLAAWWSGIPAQVCSRRVNFPLRWRLSAYKYNWLLDRILTVSVSIRQTLMQGGVRPDLITVIYEGVDVDWIDRLQPLAPLTEGNGLRVGTVAHLSAEKGHHTLLEAAARLAARFPQTCYVLAGEGRLEAELKRKAQALGIGKQVIFTGFHSDTEALMKQFDLFCLPSLSEGLSSAILAAMASGLPVVATNVGGIAELVVDGETGFLVPPGDPAALAQALARLLSSAPRRRHMGEKGRRRVESRFTLERKLDETERLYATLLRQGASDNINAF